MPWKYLGYNEPPATKAATVDDTGEDAEIAEDLKGILARLKQIQQQRGGSPKMAIQMMWKDARYLREASPHVSSDTSAKILEGASDLISKAANYLSARKQTEALNNVTLARSQVLRAMYRLSSGK